MPGRNGKSTVQELRVVADEKIQDSLKLLVEAAVKSFQQEYDIKMENLKSELAEVKNSQEFISRQYCGVFVGLVIPPKDRRALPKQSVCESWP